MSVREESVCGNEGGFLLCLMCVEHVSEGCVESLKQPLGQNGDVLTVLQSLSLIHIYYLVRQGDKYYS